MDQDSFKFLFTLNALACAAIAFAALRAVYSNPEEYGDKVNKLMKRPRNLSQEECDEYNNSRSFFSQARRAYTNRHQARRAIFLYLLLIIFCVFCLFGCWQKEILTFCKKIAQLRLSQSQMIFIQDRRVPQLACQQ